MAESTAPSCAVCGEPTASKYGICQRTPACKSAHNRRYPRGAASSRQACDVCGKPTSGKYGVCSRTLACKAEGKRRAYPLTDPEILRDRHRSYYEAHAEEQRAQKRQYSADNAEILSVRRKGYYWADPELARLKQRLGNRARIEADPDRVRLLARQASARWLSRPDRPCRYARAGCAVFALVGQQTCRKHGIADRRKRWVRRRTRLLERLSAAQSGLCSWCGLPLPEDMTARMPSNRMAVEVDHIIPQSACLLAVGYVIEEEWNLRALHWECNGAAGKWHKLTPEAIALAQEHGITLALEAMQCLQPLSRPMREQVCSIPRQPSASVTEPMPGEVPLFDLS